MSTNYLPAGTPCKIRREGSKEQLEYVTPEEIPIEKSVIVSCTASGWALIQYQGWIIEVEVDAIQLRE